MIHLDRGTSRPDWRMWRVTLVMTALVSLASISHLAADVRQSPPQAAAFECPMHPDVRATASGTCPICGMALVPTEALASPEYRLDVDTAPRMVVAGRPFRLRLTVRHPRTHAVVTQFAVVHEKRFHLFVISEDLAHYDHVHPEQAVDGSWVLDVTVPRPGRYRLYSDFLPAGGPPQVIARPIGTADADAPGAGSGETRLVPDRVLNHTIGQLSVTLELPPEGLRAGREESFIYRLADAHTGKPVADIEPYLGAWGHSLAVSEDMSRVVHAHPVEGVPEGHPSARGGPTLTFQASLPDPGRYRIWTQIKRNGEIATAVFTVTVTSDPVGHGPNPASSSVPCELSGH
jgi:hypothetical protein